MIMACLFQAKNDGTSLVVQRLGTHLSVQRSQVQSLVREDSHASEQPSLCATNTEPVPKSLQATATESSCYTTEAYLPRACALQQKKPLL